MVALNSCKSSLSLSLSLSFSLVPPQVSTDFNDVNVTAGTTIIFTCNATGFPAPDISWYKNGNYLTEKQEFGAGSVTISSYVIGNLITVSQLILQGLDLSDNGVYGCKGNNTLAEELNDTSEVFKLTVHSTFYLYACVLNLTANSYVM